uniref:DUF659 domain-containing protein n=1 Tax=Chenopodium quinoa TaxID=63459 RepID=A0A803MKJ7_CHEQI
MTMDNATGDPPTRLRQSTLAPVGDLVQGGTGDPPSSSIKNQGIAICKKVTQDDKIEMQRVDDEFEARKNDSGPREVPLPCESTWTTSDDGLASKKRKPTTSPIARAFGVEARDQLSQEIARMFYTGGLPFNLARNPHYIRSYTFAATHNLAGFKPPNYEQLRTTYLVNELNNVERQLLPLKATWKEKGVKIVCDGWSDPTRKPLINFMATSGCGPMFLKVVNCFGEVKKYFIANLMK